MEELYTNHHGLTWEPETKMEPEIFLMQLNRIIAYLKTLRYDEIHYHLHLLEKDGIEFETHEAIRESLENLELLKQEVEFCLKDKSWDYLEEFEK